MIEFYVFSNDCPWNDNGNCTGQITYNGHLNDPRYGDCHEEACPIIFWINKFIEIGD